MRKSTRQNARRSSRKPALEILWGQWGWITPGTNQYLRHEQLDNHLAFLAQEVTPLREHMMVCHCGWWWDVDISEDVKRLTSGNPEPHRALEPTDRRSLKALARYVKNGRVEPIAYPYAACVTEATTGEGLYRSLRFSREIIKKAFGVTPAILTLHDGVYCLDWTTVQQPQISTLLGFKTLWSSIGGSVKGPDGSTQKMVFNEPHVNFGWYKKGDEQRVHGGLLEMHSQMGLVEKIEAGDEKYAAMDQFSVRSVTSERYLSRNKYPRVYDSRKMGSKSWYGGCIDSLLIEQNAKSVELRLPAVEALAMQSSGRSSRKLQQTLADYWKKSFILMDNHSLWQCHNYKKHFLPQSAKLSEAVQQTEEELLGGRSKGRGRNLAVFNPTPWKRDLIFNDGNRNRIAKDVPGWGTATLDRPGSNVVAGRQDNDPYTLSNGRVTYRLNEQGEVVSVKSDTGTQRFSGLGRLLRIHDKPQNEQMRINAGQTLKGIEGSASASVTVKVPKRVAGRSMQVVVDEVCADAFIIQADRLNKAGRVIGTQYEGLRSLHWGGRGMPHHQIRVEAEQLNTNDADCIRLTLWMLVDGQLKLSPLRIRFGDDTVDHRQYTRWQVQIHTRNTYTEPKITSAAVLHSDDLSKTVRFVGQWDDCQYKLEVTLDQTSDTLAYKLALDFKSATRLGLLSPPFTEMDGSMLGAQCERPYVPGLCVLFPTTNSSKYFADKPYYIQQALVDSKRTWHTDKRDWWLKMSPFIGMNMAIAESDKRQLGLFTRGIKHFFRWRREGKEYLGLSFGASIIHPKTQGHTVSKRSDLYGIAGRRDFNPYGATPWLRAKGEYVFHYAIQPGTGGAAGRLGLWRAAQAFALPPTTISTSSAQAVAGVASSSDLVVITALDPADKRFTIRAINMTGRAVKTTISAMGRSRQIPFKPYQLKEIAWPAL